jgi:hypothetical protein
MASKLTIKEEHGGENMPLYYAVYDQEGRQVSMHYAREDAEVMAASRMMMEALEKYFTYVVYQITKYNENEYELGLAERMKAAIAAAEGE